MRAPRKCCVPGMICSLASPHFTGEPSGEAPYRVLEAFKHLLQEAFQAIPNPCGFRCSTPTPSCPRPSETLL